MRNSNHEESRGFIAVFVGLLISGLLVYLCA